MWNNTDSIPDTQEDVPPAEILPRCSVQTNVVIQGVHHCGGIDKISYKWSTRPYLAAWFRSPMSERSSRFVPDLLG